MTTEQIKEKYGDRILAILKQYADALQAAGYAVDEPCDMSGDVSKWLFTLHGKGNVEEFSEKDIDFTITICESELLDDEENGVNFMLDIVESGGRIIGKCAPYNYTEEAWVDRDDAIAIEERFQFFSKFLKDAEKTVELVRYHLRTHDGPLL